MPTVATTIAPPRFVHDCDGCVHLGSDGEHDYYFCAKAEAFMGGSIIARSGDEGPDYASCTRQHHPHAPGLRPRGWRRHPQRPDGPRPPPRRAARCRARSRSNGRDGGARPS